MNKPIFYIAGQSRALFYAAAELIRQGYKVLTAPNDTVTHLLLPTPSFDPDGSIKGGGPLEEVLSQLPKDITVVGGNLKHPALAGYVTADLLQDSMYVAQNANLTAHCAVRLAMEKLPVILQDAQVLIVGWGRIGKCLADLLRRLGARVWVAARKESDRAMLCALGYHAVDMQTLADILLYCRVVFNTAPVMVLPEDLVRYCPSECLKIDLASVPGIAGNDVLWARGLPGKDAPETSGKLIASTIIRITAGKEHIA